MPSASTSVRLRPMRSPKWPKSAEPMGRAKKATAKVASDASVAVAGSDVGKKQVRKDQHGGRGVDVKVEEFDGRADQAGKENLGRRVDALRVGISGAEDTQEFYRTRIG